MLRRRSADVDYRVGGVEAIEQSRPSRSLVEAAYSSAG